jgi:hypothetical protein
MEKKKHPVRKILGIVLIVIVALVLLVVGVCFNRIRTVCSLENVGGDLYQVEYYNDYKLDKAMEVGAGSVQEMAEFVSENILFGYPVDLSEESYSCCAFLTQNSDGEYIVGRNFDYSESPAIIIHCDPDDGYESYGMLPAYLLDLRTEEELTSLFGRACTLAMPYSIVDGVNEAGLSVVILQLDGDMTAQDTGNTDVMTTFAVRILLDKCGSVDEAVEMLGNYDMHSAVGAPYHLFIADKYGNSVVVEWPEDEMKVVDAKCVTNFCLTPGAEASFGEGFGHARYDAACSGIENGPLSEEEAMGVLKAAESVWGVEGEFETEYSVVYNLSDFTAIVTCDADFTKVFSFNK